MDRNHNIGLDFCEFTKRLELQITFFIRIAPRFLDNVAKWNLIHYGPLPVNGCDSQYFVRS
jgi:hypothetical protein